MATIDLRRFTHPDTLRHIGVPYLVELLSPSREFFASRGLELPTSPTGGRVDCERLADIFMTPDTDMPKDLTDALYVIHEMSAPETMDKLIEAAEANDIDLALPDDPAPADVAVRLWLRARALLEETHAQHHLTRPKSFLSFTTDVQPAPPFTQPSDETRHAMETYMDAWFERKKRGRGCRLFVYPREGECWFMVRHGEPCRREGSLNNGQPDSVFYRPQQHDVLVYDIAQGEIRIHAGTKGERELYLRCFGRFLFGNENVFPGEGKYTLEPLIQYGVAALRNAGIEDSIEWVRLKELEIRWGDSTRGEIVETEIRKASDLFAAFDVRQFRLQASHVLKRAVFHVKFRGVRTSRSVTLEPTNKAKYERHEDSSAIVKWLQLRNFIVEETDEDATTGNMAVP